nr:hypothetical protein CFP56_02800 [Quercus suber]
MHQRRHDRDESIIHRFTCRTRQSHLSRWARGGEEQDQPFELVPDVKAGRAAAPERTGMAPSRLYPPSGGEGGQLQCSRRSIGLARNSTDVLGGGSCLGLGTRGSLDKMGRKGDGRGPRRSLELRGNGTAGSGRWVGSAGSTWAVEVAQALR